MSEAFLAISLLFTPLPHHQVDLTVCILAGCELVGLAIVKTQGE